MAHPKQDLAWKYCEMFKDGKRVHIKCNYCGKMFKGGGIYRFKEHLAGRKGGGPMCEHVSPDVQLLMQQILDGTLEKHSNSKKIQDGVHNASLHPKAVRLGNQFGIRDEPVPGKRRKKDLAWEHCQMLENGERVQIKCNYCAKLFKGGGIHRFKEHLAGRKGQVPICEEVPLEVQQLMLENLIEITGEHKRKKKFSQKEVNAYDATLDDKLAFSGLCDDIGTWSKSEAFNSAAQNLNMFDDPEEGTTDGVRHKIKGERYNNSRDISDKVDASTLLAQNSAGNPTILTMGRFLYGTGARLDALNSIYFQLLIDLLAGGRVPTPPCHDLCGWILKKLVEDVKNDIEEHQMIWRKFGCSILVEELKAKGGRILLNILVYCSHGTVFLKSVDATHIIHSEDDLYGLLKQVVEEVGTGNVLQVITNCEEQYALAGGRLMDTFPSLYWVPCAVQCIDLILQDFEKLEWINTVIEQAKSVTRVIYNNSALLNLMKKFTLGNDIVQQGITRSATSFATLRRMAEFKLNLQTMVTSQGWTDCPYSEQLSGLGLLDIVTNRSFWSSCIFIIRLTSPLMRVLGIVSREKRAAMGYVFAGIYRAKETIKRELVKKEEYMVYWDIIDSRWEQQWKCPLYAAGFFLNPKIFYGIEGDMQNKILSKVFDCIERLIPDIEVQDKIVKELKLYKNANGDLGRKMAVRARETLLPAEWWSTYGGGCPDLARMAIRILSQTCSSSWCMQNHIAFDKVYDARNRLERQRLCDLVFVQYNLRLKQMGDASRKHCPADPVLFENIDTVEEWIMQNELCLDDEGNVDWLSLVSSSANTVPQGSLTEEAEDLAAGFDDFEIFYKLK